MKQINRREFAQKAVSGMAMNFVKRAIALLEGESADTHSSMVITVSGGDSLDIALFQYEDPVIPEFITKCLREKTCDETTEGVDLDGSK